MCVQIKTCENHKDYFLAMNAKCTRQFVTELISAVLIELLVSNSLRYIGIQNFIILLILKINTCNSKFVFYDIKTTTKFEQNKHNFYSIEF